MTDINVLAETTLRERAIAAVGELVRSHGHPTSRTQIKGLRQLAANEPGKVTEFAGTQRTRAEKRQADARGARQQDFAAEVAFWKLVGDLCVGRGKDRWSLLIERDTHLPADLVADKQPPGARLSKEEQAAIKDKNDRRKSWEQEWERRCYSAFFQAFCAEYLATMPPEKR